MMNDLIRVRGHTVWTPPLGASSVVVDAGAHRGEFSAEIYRRFGCRCIAVEANPMLSEAILAPPGGQVIHAALADSDGKAAFVFRDNLEGGSISDYARDIGNRKSLVEMMSLQTLMQHTNITEIDLLKLDIEGAEFPLIQETPVKILSRIRQISVEFHDFIPEFKGKGLFEAARARLQNCGFLCYPMAFRTRGDVLFINTRVVSMNAIQEMQIKWIYRFSLKLRDYMAGRKKHAAREHSKELILGDTD